jgi:hypothetical protein
VARSFSAFAKSMRQRAERLPEVASYVAKEGSEAVLRDWLVVMPVDTSEALSNTRIGVGQRPGGSLEPFFRGRGGSTRAASAGRALDEGLEAIATKKPGQDLFVSNTAPHIGRLDAGSSIQFAGGFLPRALIVFRVAAAEAKKKMWGKR